MLVFALVLDGVISPVVEECYFRGYLLPRIPASTWIQVEVSAGLFAMQHYWQPQNWPLIFVLQLISTGVVVRLRCLRLGIVVHTLANTAGVLIVLIPLIG